MFQGIDNIIRNIEVCHEYIKEDSVHFDVDTNSSNSGSDDEQICMENGNCKSEGANSDDIIEVGNCA
eukprot:3950378-Ditylum_brightwellii.AAC.1